MPTLATADGLQLQLHHWPCPGARGQVLIVHGLGEHCGRYEALAQAIVAQGFAVLGYDQRGHGRSTGARGAIARADALCRDLALLLDCARRLQGGPLVLLGHSMGGLLAARFVAEALAPRPAEWTRAVDALVLSSPALDPGMSAVQKLLLAVLGRLAPDLAVGNGLHAGWISRDPAVVEAYEQDPLVHDRVTPRLVRFIVDSARLVIGQAPRWTLPTLLLWAAADRCVAPAGSQAFAEAAPRHVVQAHAYGPMFHEIFNEPERELVFARLTAFLARF